MHNIWKGLVSRIFALPLAFFMAQASSTFASEGLLIPELYPVLQAAAADDYEPPSDGTLSEEQVTSFLAHAEKAHMLREGIHDSLQRGRMHSSHSHAHDDVSDNLVLRLAMIQAVKSGGGNWAEFQWIKARLTQVMLSRKIGEVARDAAATHNWRLFENFDEQIAEALAGPSSEGSEAR